MKAIIFDCDGTLADTMPIHYLAWHATLLRYGIDFDEDRFYSMGGIPTARIAAILAEEHGVELDPEAVSHEKELEYLRHLAEARPHPAVEPIAREYRGTLPMAVATGSMRWIAEKTLTHLGMLDWFDAIVCADDVTNPKPAPDIFLEAARRLGVPPTDCLVYEDTDPGVQAAAAAGMECVDVRTLTA